MATPSQSQDPLIPVLEDTEAELKRRLVETCSAEADNISSKSSAEIRELEDSLLAAAVAAGQTIALRRKLGRNGEGEAGGDAGGDGESAQGSASPTAPEQESAVPTASETTGVREFQDRTGRAWRAWLVTPGASRTSRSGKQFLGKFQQGWICFEALDSSARRRLPCQRSDWTGIGEGELNRLLSEAITAPERRPGRSPASSRSDEDAEA